MSWLLRNEDIDMGQENRENPKGVLLQYDNILKDSYVLEHGKNPHLKNNMSTHRESSVKRYRTHSTFRMESSGITATMSLRLQATEEWEKLRR